MHRNTRISKLEFLIFFLVINFNGYFSISAFASEKSLWTSGSGSIETSCKGLHNHVFPVLVYASEGEKIHEQKEITLKLLSAIPCSSVATEQYKEIVELLQSQNNKKAEIEDVVKIVYQFFSERKTVFFGERNDKIQHKRRFIFSLMSEFYDNVSLTLFEITEGNKPVFLKITMKRDNWSESLSQLSSRFANSEKSFLDSFDKTGKLRTVQVTFKETRDHPTLKRLNSELSASLLSRYRNPLPPQLSERRSFFRLAEEKEPVDVKVDFQIEMNGTTAYALIKVYMNEENSKSAWLEGTLASLPEFEQALYTTSRDMLMEVVGIYDYTANFGAEIVKAAGSSAPSALWSVSLRHNRGELAATLRLSFGNYPWSKACGKSSPYFGMGLLPGWQFIQTERMSSDVGVYANAGLMDASFTQENLQCPAKKSTFGILGYGTYAQFNYTTENRLSALARIASGGASMFAVSSSEEETVRSRTEFTLYLGLGIAL